MGERITAAVRVAVLRNAGCVVGCIRRQRRPDRKRQASIGQGSEIETVDPRERCGSCCRFEYPNRCVQSSLVSKYELQANGLNLLRTSQKTHNRAPKECDGLRQPQAR